MASTTRNITVAQYSNGEASLVTDPLLELMNPSRSDVTTKKPTSAAANNATAGLIQGIVGPTRHSPEPVIFRLANMTSTLTTIAMLLSRYTVKSFSDSRSAAFCRTRSNIAAAAATTVGETGW